MVIIPVLVFGESVKAQKRLMYQRNWKLGTDSVHEKTTHRHVGLILSTTANNTERTLQATKMIRNTFFSLVGSGLHPSNINPLTIVKTFQSVCLPRGLYGCELWSNITSREIHMLEVTLRFCAKYMQHFIKRSKTDIVLACLGITDTLSEIDKRKLLFLRRLCVSPHSAICLFIDFCAINGVKLVHNHSAGIYTIFIEFLLNISSSIFL